MGEGAASWFLGVRWTGKVWELGPREQGSQTLACQIRYSWGQSTVTISYCSLLIKLCPICTSVSSSMQTLGCGSKSLKDPKIMSQIGYQERSHANYARFEIQ